MAIAMLVLGGLLFSGCAPAVIGVGTAAVAASSTEKGLSTSVADGLIFTKIQDNFLQTDASLPTVVDVTVNDGAVLLTGKVKTPEEKVLATKLTWDEQFCSPRGASVRCGSGHDHGRFPPLHRPKRGMLSIGSRHSPLPLAPLAPRSGSSLKNRQLICKSSTALARG